MMNTSVISKNKDNGLRAVLLLELGRKTLLKDFHVYFPKDPVHLYNKLLLHEPTFKKHLKQKILKQDQYDLLLPSNGATFSKDLDITLIFYLLRTLCKYKPPKTGWNNEPQPTDNTKEANLIRLKLIRNTQQHKGPPEMTDQELADFEAKISPPLLALGCQNADITNALTCAIDNALMSRFTQEKTRADQAEIDAKDKKDHADKLEACKKNTTYNLHLTLPSFTGRHVEMNNLHTLLVNPSDHQLGTVICGMGGVGKSELARAYADKNKDYYTNNVLWINGTSELTMERSFIDIAQLIGLSIKKEIQHGTSEVFISSEVIAQKVYRFFNNQKCLVIFDNVDDKETITEFLPHCNSGNMKPSVLITSQFTQWGSYFTTLPIDVFSRQIAYDFLNNNKIHQDCDVSSINELCQLLGYHPLALQHAVSYVNVNSCTYADYASSFANEIYKLTDKSPVFATLQIALKNIQLNNKNDKILHQIIEFLPFFDGNEIDKNLILQLFSNDMIGVNKALTTLRSFSLINIRDVNRSKKEIAITVHSLVQKAILTQENRSTNHVDTLHELLSLIPSTDGKCSSKHLINIFSNNRFSHDAIQICKNESEKFVSAIIDMLLENFQFKVVISFIEEFIQHITNPIYNINLYTYIASCHHKMGELSKALQVNQNIETKKQDIFNDQHPSLLDTQNNIALNYLGMGKVMDALNLFKNLEKKQLKLFGDQNERLRTIQHNLALCFLLLGEYSDALHLLQNVEAKLIEIFGEQHPRVIGAQISIGECHVKMGNYSDALQLFQNIETKQLQSLGERHSSMLLVQCKIALCYDKMNKGSKALQFYQNVESKQIDILGDQHPDVIYTQENMASCYRTMGKYSDALQLYQIVDTKQTEIYGEQHPDVIATQLKIAMCLIGMDKNSEALDHFQSIKKKETQILGEEHQDVIFIQQVIAEIYIKMGKDIDALQVYQDIKAKQIELAGKQQPAVIETPLSVACKQLKLSGDKELDMIDTQYCIALCYMRLDKYGDALKVFQNVELKQLEIFGEDHPKLLNTQRSIALCYYHIGWYSESLGLYQKVGTKQLKLLGEKHEDYLNTVMSLAYVMKLPKILRK